MTNQTENTSNLRPLTECEKRGIDSVEIIRSGYYKCFSDRRDFEWKLSFGIWTVIALYLSALVIGKEPITVPPRILACATAIGSLLVLALHALWLITTARANDRDKRQSFEAADAIRHAVGLQWTADLKDDIAKVREPAAQKQFILRLKRRWSQLSQLCITLLLVFLASLAAYARIDPPFKKHHPSD